MTETPFPQDSGAAHEGAAGLREAGAAPRLTHHLTLPRNALVERPGRSHSR
ncbi:hypothetical protein bcgnr5379_63320 [Bacillus cereus]